MKRFPGWWLLLSCLAHGASNRGILSGTVQDQTGGLMVAVPVVARNINTGAQRMQATNSSGFYSFPALDIGNYELSIEQSGFRPYVRTGLHIDAGASVQADVSLEIGARKETIVVTETALQVESSDTAMGETVTGRTVESTPLNGRSFTDLLALQPGVVPVSSQQPGAVNMGGVTMSLPPSGDLNAGNLSVSGQRETANGFMVRQRRRRERQYGNVDYPEPRFHRGIPCSYE